MQNLGRISPCEQDIWPLGSGNYTEQTVNFTGPLEKNLLRWENVQKN